MLRTYHLHTVRCVRARHIRSRIGWIIHFRRDTRLPYGRFNKLYTCVKITVYKYTCNGNRIFSSQGRIRFAWQTRRKTTVECKTSESHAGVNSSWKASCLFIQWTSLFYEKTSQNIKIHVYLGCVDPITNRLN